MKPKQEILEVTDGYFEPHLTDVDSSELFPQNKIELVSFSDYKEHPFKKIFEAGKETDA